MSIAIPAGKEFPIVSDFATTIVAVGHLKTLLLEGKPIPEEYLINKQGKTLKPGELNMGNIDQTLEKPGSPFALQPFGTYKGYAINVAIDVLGGALNLMGTGSRARGQGVLMTALNVEAFVPVKDFKAEVDKLIQEIKSSPPRPGFEEVLLPGEREHKTMIKRRKGGIPIDEQSWKNIVDTCQKLGMDATKIMG
jgi:uncharacterized oxidoreductase